MARSMKLTTNPKDRKDQRVRTKDLISATENMVYLQESAPAHLKGVARYAWVQLWPILNDSGLVKQADKATLELLCINYQIAREAYNDVLERGVIYDNRANPSTKTLDSSTAKVVSLSRELGLTPASRATLLSVANDDEGSASLDEMREMFGG